MTDAEYSLLVKRVNMLQESVDRIDRDLASDRKDFDEMKLQQSRIVDQQKTILESLTRFQIKTKDAVQDAVEEAIEPMENTLDSFVKSKTKILKQEVRIGFFNKLFGKLKQK